MKTLNLSTGAVILGALGASFAACSASSQSTPPQGSAGSNSVGTAGATGFAGATTGFAGATTGFAGATATGTGGATGSAGAGTGPGGTGTAGAGTGTAGSGAGGGAAAMSCGTLTPSGTDPKCCIAAGTAADLPIDDLEDGDNVILPVGQRQGYWYTYGVMAAMQTPLPSEWGGTTFKPSAGGNPCSLLPLTETCKSVSTAAMGTAGTTLFSAETKGNLPPNMPMATPPVYTQAGMGFDINNHFAKSCVYNASVFHGVSFYAKGTVPFNFGIAIPATTPTTSDSGTCTAMCSDAFSMIVAPPPDGVTWKQFTIKFTDLTQAGFGTVATFDPANIINMQFQVNGSSTATTSAPFDIAIDDIAFTP